MAAKTRMDKFEEILHGIAEPDEASKATTDTAIKALKSMIADIAVELIDIALNENSAQNRLRAIKMYFTIIGIENAAAKQPLNAETIINYYMSNPDAPSITTTADGDDEVDDKPKYTQ